MEEFDGVDNGVNQYEGEAKYKISSTIGARVGRLNPSWNAPDKSAEAEMKGFEKGKLKIIVTTIEASQNLKFLLTSEWKYWALRKRCAGL